VTIVATERGVRDTVAVVAAALLPSAVLGLPVMRSVALPCDLLYVLLRRAPLLC